MDNTNLGSRIKQLRNQRAMSQEALAEESGLSLRTIQRIENGSSNPTGDTLKRLAQALNVSPDELIDWAVKEDYGFLTFFNLSAMMSAPRSTKVEKMSGFDACVAASINAVISLFVSRDSRSAP